MKEITSVLLDSSFCIRLLKTDDPYHHNVVAYFEYFLEHHIEMYLSAIVVGEYAVGDDPDHLLSLAAFKLLEFDYRDAKLSGRFTAELIRDQELRKKEQRKVIINDIKLFAQIQNRGISAYITKDRKSLGTMIQHLKTSHALNFVFLDLTLPLHEKLGTLF